MADARMPADGPQRPPGEPEGTAASEETPEALRAEVEALRARVREYENAITWETSCLACATVLDSCAAETARREQAEEKLRQARMVVESAGQAFLRILGDEAAP